MILTPRDWQQIAQGEALALAGMPEAHAKMVEAKRYGALADEIDRLRGMVGGHDDLSQALIDRLENLEVQAVREIAPGWVGIPTVEWDSIMGPNDRVEGRDAASSRRVPLERRVGRQTVKRSDDG